MNGNPSAKQKRFHNALREWYFYTQMHNGVGELHHIFGSKANFKLLQEEDIDRAGEWFVIMIPKTVHDDIKNYSFEAERGLFLDQRRKFERYFSTPIPVPEKCFEYYEKLTSKHQGLKSWSE